jgi:hypothetical protein
MIHLFRDFTCAYSVRQGKLGFMEMEYLQSHAAAQARMAGKREEATPARAGIVLQAARLVHWLGRALADPVGERLEQQRLLDEQLLRRRR